MDLLTGMDNLGCKLPETPIEMNHKLGNTQEDVAIEKDSYQRLVGKLIFLSHIVPGIIYAVGVVNQFLYNLKVSHVRAMNTDSKITKNKIGKRNFIQERG